MKVIVVRESVFQSVIKDSFMFGSLFALWFLNHKFCNGSGIIDVCVALFVLFGAINHVKKYYSPKEAADALRELALQDIKESRKSSHNNARDAIAFLQRAVDVRIDDDWIKEVRAFLKQATAPVA